MNVHAVLVHESRDCIVDLVQNLHHLDPQSAILLYDGGGDPSLLKFGFDFDRYHAVVHPSPRRMRWGWLHDFALDCFRFAAASLPFTTMTIVDSDQLALRAGYSQRLESFLRARPRAGLLGNAHSPQSRGPRAPPAAHALKEFDLWRPFLRQFPSGEEQFVHWTFWPSTVFTAEAARALTGRWDGDPLLGGILQRTRIWASEEVILPTLVALLGFEVVQSPCRYDYVRYRVRYSPGEIESAMAQPDCFWAHPIPRRYDDPLRARIRSVHRGYGPAPAQTAAQPVLMPGRIVAETRHIEGWLEDDEAELLLGAAAGALSRGADRLAEVGSHCGKATVLLARVAEALRPAAVVHAIDPGDGLAGAADGVLRRLGPTTEKLRRNLLLAGVAGRVRVHARRAAAAAWDGGPIGLLLVDGLHDYANVAEDFAALSPHVPEGGLVAFHDYADYFPGVRLFVDEQVRRGCLRKIAQAGSLVVLEKRTSAPAAAPLVSCIMPTADRRRVLPLALRCFLRQDHPALELIVVDDGRDEARDLIPADPRVRYLRLSSRRSIGAKRNLACAEASGEFVLHWDDDDWSAPWRAGYQAAALAGADLCGLSRVRYHRPATGQSWRYVYPASERPWVSGNSLGYTRAFWRRNPFPDADVGEDARFVWADPSRRMVQLPREEFLVAMIHERNVDRKRTSHRFWQPLPTQEIEATMGGELAEWRAALAASPAAASTGTGQE